MSRHGLGTFWAQPIVKVTKFGSTSLTGDTGITLN